MFEAKLVQAEFRTVIISQRKGTMIPPNRLFYLVQFFFPFRPKCGNEDLQLYHMWFDVGIVSGKALDAIGIH